jgi:hypothetical protein
MRGQASIAWTVKRVRGFILSSGDEPMASKTGLPCASLSTGRKHPCRLPSLLWSAKAAVFCHWARRNFICGATEVVIK